MNLLFPFYLLYLQRLHFGKNTILLSCLHNVSITFEHSEVTSSNVLYVLLEREFNSSTLSLKKAFIMTQIIFPFLYFSMPSNMQSGLMIRVWKMQYTMQPMVNQYDWKYVDSDSISNRLYTTGTVRQDRKFSQICSI